MLASSLIVKCSTKHPKAPIALVICGFSVHDSPRVLKRGQQSYISCVVMDDSLDFTCRNPKLVHCCSSRDAIFTSVKLFQWQSKQIITYKLLVVINKMEGRYATVATFVHASVVKLTMAPDEERAS